MKKYAVSISAAILAAFLFYGCQKQKPTENEKRETVLDGVVHIKDDLVTNIPRLEPWCDRLDLEKRRIEVSGCELYVEEEGQGTPLVLLHGGPGATHHEFHPSFSRAKKFARIIYYDQRGCGLSDYERGAKYSVKQAVQDLDNLRQSLNIKKWVVVGHSYGGFLAQVYSTQYPENIAGLVLVSSSTGMHTRLKPTRQYDYISEEEKQRMKEIPQEVLEMVKSREVTQEKALELIVFNNHLNGDWKRQNFYKPSPEELAQKALYDWKPAPRFRADMQISIKKINLEGAFENCPIPSLIMEGQWDLTWNTDKPEVLHQNHPGAKLVMFQRAGHTPFADEPQLFFTELKTFLQQLPEIPEEDIVSWKEHLKEWQKEETGPPLANRKGAQEAVTIEESS